MDTALETLNNMLQAFETWLDANVSAGRSRQQSQSIGQLADSVRIEGAAIRAKLESDNLTTEQSCALVDPFSLTVARTKLQILRVLGRSPEDIAARSESGGGGVGTLVAFSLAAVVLLYFARK